MKKFRESIRRISLILFLTAMLLCALLAFLSLWGVFDSGYYDGFDSLGPIIPSLFIIGFASFLIWTVCVVSEIREKIIGKG